MITQGDGGTGGGGSTPNFCSVTPADQAGNLDNILSRLTAIETILSQLLGTDITAIQLSDISQDLGTILGANILNGVLGDNLAQGYVAYAFQEGADPSRMSFSPTGVNSIPIPAGQEAIIPIQLSARMRFGGVMARMTGSLTNNINWQVDIYKESNDSDAGYERAATCPSKSLLVPSYSMVPIKASPYPTELAPGAYYLSFKNTGSYQINIAGQDPQLTNTTSSFFNMIRVGIYNPDPEIFNPIGVTTRYLKTAYIGMFGVIDGEEYPYGFDIVNAAANSAAYGW